MIKNLVCALLTATAAALLAGIWLGSWRWIATAIVAFFVAAWIDGPRKRHEAARYADQLAALAAHPERLFVPLSRRQASPDWPEVASEVLWQASLTVDDDPSRAQARLSRYGITSRQP